MLVVPLLKDLLSDSEFVEVQSQSEGIYSSRRCIRLLLIRVILACSRWISR